jgi:hypothetical protein
MEPGRIPGADVPEAWSSGKAAGIRATLEAFTAEVFETGRSCPSRNIFFA